MAKSGNLSLMTDTLFWHTARGIAANIVLMDDV